MAKKKKPRVESRPQNWFLDLGRDRAAELSRLAVQRGNAPWSRDRIRHFMRFKRVSESEYLREAVLGPRDPKTGKRKNGLRDFFHGFDAKDGFDLRHPENLTARQAKTIRQYATYLHNLQSTPYIKVVPRSKRMRAALEERTGQASPRFKNFVYHTEKPNMTKVRYTKGVLEEQQKLSGKTTVIRRYYFFRDYNHGVQPKTFDEMIEIADSGMVEEMPDVYYTLWTDLHGAIGAPIPKSMLMRKLREYEAQYGTHKGFAEALLGFAFQGTSDQADTEYVNRLRRRSKALEDKTQKAKIRKQRLRVEAQMRKPRRCEAIGRGGRCRLKMGHRGAHRYGEKKR